MPTCMRCGTMVPQKEDMTLVRDENGRWRTLCQACGKIEAPAPEVKEETAPPAKMESTPQPTPSLETLAEKGAEKAESAFVALHQVLENIDKNAPEDEPDSQAHERAYKRHTASLRLSFRLLRDDRSWDGTVKDISKGGLCFIAPRELRRGQILTLEVLAPKDTAPDETKLKAKPEAEATTIMIQAPGEVRRVEELENGDYEIGIRFVRHGRTHETNRRRFRRHYVRMIAYFSRKGSEYTTKGEVLDISKNGARIIVDEELVVNEEFRITLRGEEGVFVKADLIGTARCIRVLHRRAHEWEMGCEFIDIHTRPRVAAPPANA